MSTHRIHLTAATAALALALTACASGGGVVVTSGPSADRGPGDRGPSTAATLGIPPGHLPPQGECRVWVPGTPPGHQRAPGACSVEATRVPAHGWLVYNPGGKARGKGRGKGHRGKGRRGRGHRGGGKGKAQIRVTVYGSSAPVTIRWFDKSSGKLVREEEADD